MAILTLAALTKAIIEYFKPDVLVGAVGRAPGCFTKEVVEAMVAVQEAKGAGGRPIIFALSNPKTQAEITAAGCYFRVYKMTYQTYIVTAAPEPACKMTY